MGCEARKIPAVGVVLFLDFSFYRTNRNEPGPLEEGNAEEPIR
jgi:hypothetical protein